MFVRRHVSPSLLRGYKNNNNACSIQKNLCENAYNKIKTACLLHSSFYCMEASIHCLVLEFLILKLCCLRLETGVITNNKRNCGTDMMF